MQQILISTDSRTELSLLEQVSLVAPQMIQAKLVGGLAEVLCEPLHEAQIVADRGVGVVTALEFLEHHLAKVCHSGLPHVPHTLNRPQNYSTATTAATAAPAASFLPPIRNLRGPTVWRYFRIAYHPTGTQKTQIIWAQ